MVNEDILTGLRNAIERGDNLDNATKVMINSGYNARDVEESSRFINSGVLSVQVTRADEHLAMPNKKGFFSFFNKDDSKAPIPPKPEPNKKIQETIKENIKPSASPNNPTQTLVQNTIQKIPQQNQQPNIHDTDGSFLPRPQYNSSSTISQPTMSQNQTMPQIQPSIMQPRPNIVQISQEKPEFQNNTNNINNIDNTKNIVNPPQTDFYTPSSKTSSLPITQQLEQLKPKKQGHLKEIFLLIILLFLMGLLVTTVIFRNKISEMISGFLG
jgi:hypothetical protein